MKKALGFWLMFVVSMATTAYAADTIVIDFGSPITMNVSAGQKAFLARMLGRENALRAARTPPDTALTLEQYVQQIILATIQGYKLQDDSLSRNDACARFQALSPSQQATIIARPEWNGSNPCP